MAWLRGTLLLPVVVVACAGGAGNTNNGDGGPTSTTDGGPAEAGPTPTTEGGATTVNDAGSCDPSLACARTTCAALGPDCAAPFQCGGATLCERAFFLYQDGASSSGGGGITFGKNGPDTEANAKCALVALRDRKPGRITWGYSGGVTSYGETIDIVEGRVFGTFALSVDSPAEKGAYQGIPLPPATFFADCLATNDLDRWAKCLASVGKSCP